jgi:ectoine hydroxylase-related dioxygenase (phytanoyl-CoA dioxygenase family)
MGMDSGRQELDTQRKQLKEEGYVILRDFFDKEKINTLLWRAKSIFEIQFHRFGYEGDFESKMKRLYKEQFDVFTNCGKLIQQGLIELYSISTNQKLLNKLTTLGLSFPNLCTRPVLFFNHPELAKDEVYYKTPLHQDWPSMQSSLDSLVVWIPLIDVNAENGSIFIYPKTHKLGNICDTVQGGFAAITEYDLSEYEEIQPELKVGDIAIFSTFLVHKSGDITNDQIRWSCHFRYTNMLDKDFIDRGYPHPYIYKPVFT